MQRLGMPVTVVPATEPLITACLGFDYVAATGGYERRTELAEAMRQNRMFVALLDDSPVGYAVRAPWFFGVPFLELLYMDARYRRQGLGDRLVADFEERFGPKLFTSTNQSNQAMQSLLERRAWEQCGTIDGLDEGDPEVFFRKLVAR